MYRAPEMVDTWSNFTIGPAVDIWALGCILYTLCFMRHPFEDAAKLRILNANYSIPSDSKYSCFHDIIRKSYLMFIIFSKNSYSLFDFHFNLFLEICLCTLVLSTFSNFYNQCFWKWNWSVVEEVLIWMQYFGYVLCGFEYFFGPYEFAFAGGSFQANPLQRFSIADLLERVAAIAETNGFNPKTALRITKVNQIIEDNNEGSNGVKTKPPARPIPPVNMKSSPAHQPSRPSQPPVSILLNNTV